MGNNEIGGGGGGDERKDEGQQNERKASFETDWRCKQGEDV